MSVTAFFAWYTLAVPAGEDITPQLSATSIQLQEERVQEGKRTARPAQDEQHVTIIHI